MNRRLIFPTELGCVHRQLTGEQRGHFSSSKKGSTNSSPWQESGASHGSHCAALQEPWCHDKFLCWAWSHRHQKGAFQCCQGDYTSRHLPGLCSGSMLLQLQPVQPSLP